MCNYKDKCSDCGHSYPPMQLFKVGEGWLCESCYMRTERERVEKRMRKLNFKDRNYKEEKTGYWFGGEFHEIG